MIAVPFGAQLSGTLFMMSKVVISPNPPTFRVMQPLAVMLWSSLT